MTISRPAGAAASAVTSRGASCSRSGHAHHGASADHPRATGPAQPQNDLAGLRGLVSGERVDERQRGAGVGQVHEPLGDSNACLVVADYRESDARQHLGGASRRHVGLRVGLRVLAFPHVAQVQDGARRLRTGDAVRGKARVALELAHRALGEGAEDAVDRAAREAEDAERLLEHAHVGAVEVRHAQVEHAVAEREARVDECRPRLRRPRTRPR